MKTAPPVEGPIEEPLAEFPTKEQFVNVGEDDAL
jgi:hypothetical protein